MVFYDLTYHESEVTLYSLFMRITVNKCQA